MDLYALANTDCSSLNEQQLDTLVESINKVIKDFSDNPAKYVTEMALIDQLKDVLEAALTRQIQLSRANRGGGQI